MNARQRTFVGFGFGAIQSGLFLYEAYASGNFSRFVVAEVDGELVQAVRENGGAYTVNVARRDRIDQVRVEGVEVYNPKVAGDRERIVEAIGEADEMATALPSVKFYDMGGEASVAGMLREGLEGRKKAGVIYAAENHNEAAEILEACLRSDEGGEERHEGTKARRHEGGIGGVQVVNTVIGKMSGVIGEGEVMERMGLARLTPGGARAVLVEEFNRILISRVRMEGFRRGIGVFVEKDDLLPFEEAKLYGHNAIHALIGYLAALRGYGTMAEAGGDEWIMGVARRAFLLESGKALVRKYGGLDELFTEEGWRGYAEDLLERMIRPNLNDLVARVIRDPARKLGYEDRLFGTMRLALGQGVEPVGLAMGAAAGVVEMVGREEKLTEKRVAEVLRGIWGERVDEFAERLVGLTWRALGRLRGERRSGVAT